MPGVDDILDQLSPRKLRFSAQRGNPIAQCHLALILNAEGHYESAAYWYRLSATQGYAHAQYNLGCLLLNGLGVPEDHAEALSWFQAAAIQGKVEAIYNLGYMKERGLGCERDKREALRNYLRAAEEGDSDARYKVAMILLEPRDKARVEGGYESGGWEVVKDSTESRRLLQLAANDGHRRSLTLLRELGWRG